MTIIIKLDKKELIEITQKDKMLNENVLKHEKLHEYVK